MTKYFNVLLIFAPVAIAGEFLGWSPTIVFWSAALAVIPLAGILGKGTEELAAYTGPQLSGFLNGTLGNAAELIITIFAIKEGLVGEGGAGHADDPGGRGQESPAGQGVQRRH